MKRKILFFLGALLLVSMAGFYFLMEYGYSKGSRSGRLVKLSEKGYLIKEWEGTLDLGGGINLTWDFSLHDDRIAKELMNHMGEVVNLDYKEHLIKFIYATKYEVTDWKLKDLNQAKLCPFLYLLEPDREVLKKAAVLIKTGRPDLAAEVEECLRKIAP